MSSQLGKTLAQKVLSPKDLEIRFEIHELNLAQTNSQNEDLGLGPDHFILNLAQDGPQLEGLEFKSISIQASRTQEDAEVRLGSKSLDPCPSQPYIEGCINSCEKLEAKQGGANT